MEGLETPYEIEIPIDFIDCASCNKSIRSETLYKIHLTTVGHMKKEEALVANGFAIRNHSVPDFGDIMQYLQYLNLDEPIIGLSHLEEVIGSDANDPQPGPRYFCRLCSLEANLPNMINHIIGRKHRQKYLMTQRKDLVTWDNSTSFNQPAKVIRAKSEVVERQDGRGTPRPMRRNEGKSNITRVPQKQRNKKNPQNAGHHGAPHYPGPAHQPGHYPQHEGQPPPFHPDDHYLGLEEGGRGHSQRRMPGHSSEQEGYMENDHNRQEFMDSDYHRDYPKDPMGGGNRDYPFLHAEGRPMHGVVEEMPRREAYEREASPYRGPHPESDPLKQFYSEELRRERARANEAAASDRMNYPSPDPQDTHPGDDDDRTYAYPPGGAERRHPGGHPHGPRYPPEAPGRGSIDYPHESARFNDELRRGAPAPEESYQEEYCHRAGYPEAQHRDYADGHHPRPGYPDQDRHGDPEPRRNTDQPLDRDHLFEMVGALRNQASPYQTPPEGGRGMSEIPETFRRFLQGNASSQDARKRKSRFSDATQEEMEGSKRMSIESVRFTMFEEPGPSRHGTSRERHEAHGSQRLDPYTKSQSQHQNEGYPEGNVENAKDGGKVFDLLKNIEIENGEEADFLKSRLCNLLKEFQAKKSEKTLQNRPDSAPITRDYNHRSEAPRAPSPPGAEPGREAFREGMQRRPMETHPRAMEPHPRPSQDPRGWEEEEEEEEQGGPPDERFQEHRRPIHSDSNVSSRQRYEEVFGGVMQHRAPHSPHPEELARHRDRFQDQGDRFQDQGDRFQDQGDRFQNQGDRFQDQGDRFQDQGDRFQDMGDRFQDQGDRFQDQGDRFQDQGDRFQDQGDHYEYPPASREFLGGRSASPSYHRKQGYRMPRGLQQSSSLDKITSTLLELVARK